MDELYTHSELADTRPENSFTSPNAFLRLPEEIHTHIMSFLPIKDMLAHARTCKLLYLHLTSSLHLQSLLALSAQSLAPLPTTLSAAHTLALLHEHTTSWQAVKPKAVRRLRLPLGAWMGWRRDVRGGWYAECDEQRVVLVKLSGWKDLPDGPPEPGGAEDEEEQAQDVRIIRPLGGRAEGSIEEILLDPGQDLLVCITRSPDRSSLTLHYLTLHGLPHPVAPSPRSTYSQTWAGDFPGVKLLASSISNNLVALVILSFVGRRRVNELVVYDWTSWGEWRASTGWRMYESLAFLDERVLVAGCLTGETPALDVWRLEPTRSASPSSAHTVPSASSTPATDQPTPERRLQLHLTHSFNLPPLRPDTRISLSFSPNRSTQFRSATTYPWHCPPHDQLLAITLHPTRVTSRVAEGGQYVLFVLARTLLSPPPFSFFPAATSGLQRATAPVPRSRAREVLVTATGLPNVIFLPSPPPSPTETEEEDDNVPRVPWAAWAPKAQIIPLPQEGPGNGRGREWASFVYATRAVVPSHPTTTVFADGARAGEAEVRAGGRGGGRRYTILDFSPYPLIRNPSVSSDRLIPSTLPQNPYFLEPVTAGLAYRSSELVLPDRERAGEAGEGEDGAGGREGERAEQPVGVWCDEERVVVVRRQEGGVGLMGERMGRHVLDVYII